MKKNIGLILILIVSILIGYTHLPNYVLANEIIDEH